MDVHVFLEDALLTSARAGEHNFIGLMQRVLEGAGYRVMFLPENDRPAEHTGLSLVHMKPPLGQRGLTFRRVYHYPFWQIETTDRRWDWDVARTPYNPPDVPAKDALRFQAFWRKRLYGADHAPQVLDGPVYIPLQGRLGQKRSFQTMSPIAMLEQTLEYERERDIVVTLHPKERYADADLSALNRIARLHPRLSVVAGGPGEYLPRCAYVVTQNSGVAFDGFFFNRPAILFARIDFHHIAQNIMEIGAEQAFHHVLTEQTDFASYLHWFWQQRSINAGREDAADKIKLRFENLGWPM
jgi:hypothetical protein